jgi:hypothetical protein
MPSHNCAGNIAFATALTVILVLFAHDAFANPVAQNDAASAVAGWLKQPGRGLGTALGNTVSHTEVHVDATGAPSYYVIYLNPSGFVIVPADDFVEPIICFSPSGQYIASDSNPLGALVTHDVPARVAGARANAATPTPDMLAALAKWNNFRIAGGEAGYVPPKTSVADPRVDPLTQTAWAQPNPPSQLGNEGFLITTMDGNVVIAGGGSPGVMYGAYTLLE